MADYWKSQDKKFCEFCKCWIADNKPSINFHENGRKHKNNVSKKLSSIARRSAKEAKNNAKVQDQVRAMETEAMKSYMQDLDANADLTSQTINARLGKSTKKTEKQILEELDNMKRPHRREWYESRSNEGHTYYWNIKSQDSRWDPPPEGYVSLDEQRKAAKIRQKEEEVEAVQHEEEMRAWRQREMMKVFRITVEEAQKKLEASQTASASTSGTEEEKKTDPWNTGIEGGVRVNPYGKWIPVQATKTQKPIDLQLPVQENYVEIYVPPVEEPKPEIKEKTITSLEADEETGSTPTTFKKRKLNKCNIRQREEED